MVQKRGIHFETQIQLLFLLAVDLFNSPFLETVRRDWVGDICRKGGNEEGQGASGRCVIVRGGDLEVDSDELQVCLDRVN